MAPRVSRTDRALGGWFWMAFGGAVQGVVTLGVLAVLARLLSPLDFGSVASGLLIINLSSILTQGLMGAALVQHPKLEDAHVRSAFTVAVLGSTLLCGALWVLAPSVAVVLRASALIPIVRALAWMLPVEGVGSIAEALLRRDLQFRTVASIRMASYTVGYGAVGIGVALAGGGLWALVAANAAQVSLNTVLLLRARPHRMRLGLHRAALAELSSFSGGFMLGRIGNYAAVNGDYLVVVKTLGVASLGLYERAYDLMAKPATFIGQVLDDVLFPVIAQIQTERARVAGAYRRCVAAVALVSLPLTSLALILAPEIVGTLLGPRWNDVTAPFQILVLGTVFRTSYKISDSLTRALGAVYRRAWRQWTYAALVIGGGSIGRHWGLSGVAWAVLFALFANFCLTAHLGTRLLAMPWSDYARAHGPGLKAAVVVAVPAFLAATLGRALHLSPVAVLALALLAVAGCVALLLTRDAGWLLGADGRWLTERAIGYVRTKLQGPRAASVRTA